jgi:hypothetical protein
MELKNECFEKTALSPLDEHAAAGIPNFIWPPYLADKILLLVHTAKI